jgi:transcriptional regulator with XRE-family HTH domain
MTDIRVLLARNMKRCREILGLSQMKLADRVGCSTTLIGNIEIGKRFPSAENLNKIAAALDIPPSELFAEESAAIDRMQTTQELRARLEKKVLKAIGDALSSKS